LSSCTTGRFSRRAQLHEVSNILFNKAIWHDERPTDSSTCSCLPLKMTGAIKIYYTEDFKYFLHSMNAHGMIHKNKKGFVKSSYTW
jgi:hypothetical protein